MTTLTMPSAEHTQFDAICAPVEEFETLPTVNSGFEYEDSDWGERDEPLEHLILAGLVAPH
jgi:hypothetical protein